VHETWSRIGPVVPPSDPNEPERKLHRAHPFGLRGGPFFLAAIGVYLVLIGTLAGKPEAEAIATTPLGVVACVTAGVVTRAGSLQVDKGSVKAALAPVVDLDPGEWRCVRVWSRRRQRCAGSPS
jgi:hypothetical protein